MINHFRDQMPRPLVGIGHSFGGNIMCVINPTPSIADNRITWH